jgi:hypothetical protein
VMSSVLRDAAQRADTLRNIALANNL